MNTDQAFELLKNAGISEEISIKIVRRWLSEGKIHYQGKVKGKNRYILDNREQAYHMLMDAGVSSSNGIQIVKRMLHEGKIQDGEKENGHTQYIPKAKDEHKALKNDQELQKVILRLKSIIKAQEDQIKGIEELHKNSFHKLVQEKEKLNHEMAILKKEKGELQREISEVLKENIDLRKKLLKIKEEGYQGDKNETRENKDKTPDTIEFRQKLGLSRRASEKDILAQYKKLLKLAHPDQGGNAAIFHYIKSDYDDYKNSRKG